MRATASGLAPVAPIAIVSRPEGPSSMHPPFSLSHFLVRLQLSCALVFGTYNPSGRSYYHWATADTDMVFAKLLVGVGLLAAYWLILVISWLALDAVGMALLGVLGLGLAGTIWQLGVFPSDPWIAKTLVLGAIATLCAIGLSFAGARYRLSRQVQSSSISRRPLF